MTACVEMEDSRPQFLEAALLFLLRPPFELVSQRPYTLGGKLFRPLGVCH